MKLSQVQKASTIVTLITRLEILVADIEIDPVKKAKVTASLAKLKVDFTDGAGLEADPVTP
jgi:hypothetical protein